MLKKNQLLVEDIQKRAYNLLVDLTNYNENDKGYGLTLDHNMKPNVASIAATGFVLSGYIIGVKYGYISYDKAKKIVTKTLETLVNNVGHYKGMFLHFVDIHTAERFKKNEYSTIDTLLCIKGVMSVEMFFDDEKITSLSRKIIDRIDWNHFVHTKDGKKMFYMAYNPDRDGDYAAGKSGFIFQWHMLAEQLLMYVIAAGSGQLNKKLALQLYEGFERVEGSYQGHKYFHSPGNTLFVYQYPLCWFDGKNYIDKDGFSWFENTKKATLGHRAWNLRNMHKFKTFSRYTFGLTASSTPTGYGVFHCIPSDSGTYLTDGTVQPNAMVGALVTNPKYALEAIRYMKSIDHVYTEYGFVDGYNFEKNQPWYSNRYITIDKGLELLMCNHYLSKDVVDAFMRHSYVQKGMEVLEWKKI